MVGGVFGVRVVESRGSLGVPALDGVDGPATSSIDGVDGPTTSSIFLNANKIVKSKLQYIQIHDKVQFP